MFGTRAGTAAHAEASPNGQVLPTKAQADLPPAALLALRQGMSRDAGVLRDRTGLLRLLDQIDGLAAQHGTALPLIAARMVAQAALNRSESRGAHWRSDYPEPKPARRTFTTLAALTPKEREAAE